MPAEKEMEKQKKKGYLKNFIFIDLEPKGHQNLTKNC